MSEDLPLLATHSREVERRDSLRAARWVQLPVTSVEPVTGPSPELVAAPSPRRWGRQAGRRLRGSRLTGTGQLLMPPTLPPQRGIDSVGSTTPMPEVDVALHLSTRTVAWLADHPHARQSVRSVWDKLTELERSGQYPGAIDALRRVLTHHQPTSAGRCRTCRRATWRRPAFPCTVWHQIRFDLLGLFAGASRHRQPAGQSSSPGPSGSGNAPTTATAATGDR